MTKELVKAKARLTKAEEKVRQPNEPQIGDFYVGRYETIVKIGKGRKWVGKGDARHLEWEMLDRWDGSGEWHAYALRMIEKKIKRDKLASHGKETEDK